MKRSQRSVLFSVTGVLAVIFVVMGVSVLTAGGSAGEDRSVFGLFGTIQNAKTYVVTVTKQGNATGQITFNGGDVPCGEPCEFVKTASSAPITEVNGAANSNVRIIWSEDCTVTPTNANQCRVNWPGASSGSVRRVSANVTATFELVP